MAELTDTTDIARRCERSRRLERSASSGLPVDVVDPVDLFGIGLDGGQV
jgi:hypothetical protein